MEFEEYRRLLIKAIEDALKDFSKAIPGIQDNALEEALQVILELDVRNGKLVNNAANLRRIGAIRNKLEGAILNDDLQKALQQLVEKYNTIAAIHDKYFSSMDLRPPREILNELQLQAQGILIRQLEAEIDARMIPGIQEILRINVTQGGSYRQLTSHLLEYIVGKGEITGSYGKLAAQASTLVVDSLNTYSANYSLIVSQKFGLEWYMYVGSLLETSREWCERMVQKKYVHISELDEVLKGEIDGYQVQINPKTELWYGAKDGTDRSNIMVLRGGWRCGHQFLPTSESSIPKDVRIATYDRMGIKHKDGIKLAA